MNLIIEMGVTGLWQLVESSGKPVPLDTLENKVLAVGKLNFILLRNRFCEKFILTGKLQFANQHPGSVKLIQWIEFSAVDSFI